MDSIDGSVNYRWLFEHPLDSFFIGTLKRHLMDGWAEYIKGVEGLLKSRKESTLLFSEYVDLLEAFDSRKPRQEILALARDGFGDVDSDAPGTFQDKALFIQVFTCFYYKGLSSQGKLYV
jgi:hypothetical protein